MNLKSRIQQINSLTSSHKYTLNFDLKIFYNTFSCWTQLNEALKQYRAAQTKTHVRFFDDINLLSLLWDMIVLLYPKGMILWFYWCNRLGLFFKWFRRATYISVNETYLNTKTLYTISMWKLFRVNVAFYNFPYIRTFNMRSWTLIVHQSF